jgi:hypothetical protein
VVSRRTAVFRNVTRCILVEVFRRFRRICRILYLAVTDSNKWFFLDLVQLIYLLCCWMQMVHLKRRHTCTGLHDITFHNTPIFTYLQFSVMNIIFDLHANLKYSIVSVKFLGVSHISNYSHENIISLLLIFSDCTLNHWNILTAIAYAPASLNF